MRRNNARTPIMVALSGLLASLVVFISPGTATAAETIPEQLWPAVAANSYQMDQVTTSPQGEVTIGCYPLDSAAQDLTTYSATGAVVRQISRTSQIDGVNNCIKQPVVDKNGALYGTPVGGANLLAYQGNTLKWKYPHGCGATPTRPTIGADGNIYFIGGNQRLIGLTPNVPTGQSQPAKVLDVPVNGYCGGNIRAYKHGLTIGEASTLIYYSYSGMNLGSPPGNYWGDRSYPIDADGRLFYPTLVSGTTTSLNISAYDPSKKTVLWTKLASTTGSNVSNFYASLPIPGGGVVVVFRQQKMVSDSVPASPSEVVYAIVSLSPSGLKLWTKQLSSMDTEGNSSSAPRLSADTKGNVVLVRPWRKPGTTTDRFEFVTLDVFNAASGDAVTTTKVMSGNSDEASGAYGYALQQAGTAVPIGPEGVYVNAHACAPTFCPTTNYKLYAFKVAGLGMDYPRGTVLSAAPRPTGYLALGDSFSSGEGVTPFAANTDIPGVNTCHRSDKAYPRLIAGSSAKIPSLGSDGFRACSGAVTQNITDVPQWNEGTQLDLWPDSTTKVVTLSIGGNDIGFSAFGQECFWRTCDSSTTIYTNTMSKINNDLPGKLEATYKKILQYAPNAKIYVVGYPHVVGVKTTTTANDSRCPYLQDGSTKWADARAARDVVTQLNVKIKAKVDAVRALSAGNLRLSYVPFDGTGSPFKGHEVCGTSVSWFQNVDQALFNSAYVFHPNDLGQSGYSVGVGAAINAG